MRATFSHRWCRHWARRVDAVIEAARKNGVREVVVTIDEATVRIPLTPDKPIAEDEQVVL
jgi:hypothetical protein